MSEICRATSGNVGGYAAPMINAVASIYLSDFASPERRPSPDAADVLAYHRRVDGAAEGLPEFRHVDQHAVHAVAAGGVGIGLGADLGALLGRALTPDLPPGQEEAL